MYNNEMIWLDIISKMYKDLHNSKRVLHSSNISDTKRVRLMKYFNRLEEIHNKVSKSKRKSDELLLKSFYYDLYIIKPENIPDAYFENQKRILRERGHGNIEIMPEERNRMIQQIIEDQKESLDKWIEYFLYDEESESYQMWEKYWVFQGLQSLGKYNKETFKFSKRDKTTIYPFPPVEREYIFTTLKLMEDYIKDKTGDNEIRAILGNGNFKLLYEYVIKQSLLKNTSKSNSTEGKWIKYEQGSDYKILRESLQGYYTNWCIAAGENFAKSQLARGDFYVYYTKDKKGEARVPRIAIRMNGHYEIGEIRGVSDNQNMEPEMMSILNEKLKDFPDRNKYYKKEQDMNILTLIENKVNNDIGLTKEELIFLYEINEKIEGFGYNKDPRIEKIKSKRNSRRDLARIYNIMENEVALSQEEWEKAPKKYKFVLSGLNLIKLTSAKGLVLPQNIGGSLWLNSLTSIEGLKLPQNIGGSLWLNSLTNAENLKLPQNIGGSLDLSSLTSVENLVLPNKIGDSLYLNRLTNADGVVFPQNIGNDLYLNNLTSAKSLKLPKNIGGDLKLSSLINAEGLVLTHNINGSLNLSGLTNVDGLVLPENINGNLWLSSLTNVENLKLPQNIEGSLDLGSLISAKNLVLPKNVGNSLNLGRLINVDGLVFPQNIGNDLYLNDLISAKGLQLPQNIGGSLDLSSLISAEGLVLPQNIGNTLYLNRLINAERLVVPYDFDMDNLYCTENIKEIIMMNYNIYYRVSLNSENKNINKKRRQN